LLKLVFYTKDIRLKVRKALPEEESLKFFNWRNKFKFLVSTTGDFTMDWTSLLPDMEAEDARALIELVSARYPLSPEHDSLKNICPDLLFTQQETEWIFYGGSFNPFHRGHQACLDLLPENKLCLVVPDKNPQKELEDSGPVVTILQISTNARFKKNQFLVPTFLLKDEKNPTVEWVQEFKKNNPKKKISLLMGFDSLANIKTWIRYQDLLSTLNGIYVVSRLEEENSRLEILEEMKRDYPDLVITHLGRHDFEDLSSTKLRNKK
jgi:nicotinic acid mononucleotide adenylyltransferase